MFMLFFYLSYSILLLYKKIFKKTNGYIFEKRIDVF